MLPVGADDPLQASQVVVLVVRASVDLDVGGAPDLHDPLLAPGTLTLRPRLEDRVHEDPPAAEVRVLVG